MTRRLYESTPWQLSFTSEVLSCTQEKRGWQVLLRETAFYPEGGGQQADQGSLGGVRVLDVHETPEGILHLCDGPLAVGTAAEGHVDYARRLDHSQQHTGEHIFSGLTCRRFHCDNVGFHLGPQEVTVDFNAAFPLSEALAVEELANAAIWRNQPVKAWYPDPDELAALPYRSKKALTGPVRIVAIDDVDCCACCGTHMPATGGVGQIKVTNLINYKGGVRITLLCGGRALKGANALLAENRAVSQLLSAKQGQLAPAVERLLQERDALRFRLNALVERLFAEAAAAEADKPVRVVVAEGLPASALRKAAGTLAQGATLALVLLPEENGGWQFALSATGMDVRPAVQALCQAFDGRGGGAADMAQGRLAKGTAAEFRAVLEGLCAG